MNINDQLLTSSERQYSTIINTQVVQRFHDLRNEVFIDLKNVSILNAYDFSHFNIQYIILNDSLSSIPLLCFGHCANLKSITIPNECVVIDEDAFLLCTSLTDVKFNNKLKYIKNNAFHDCNSLTNVVIPDSVTDIGMECFRKCKNLHSITLSKNLKLIPYNAFYGCDLTYVYIPKNIKYIGPYAFAYNKNLKYVEFESLDVKIDYKAFYKTKISHDFRFIR